MIQTPRRSMGRLLNRPRPPLAYRIWWLRKRMGFQQAGAAALLGVHRVTLSGWETGAVVPSDRALEDLSRVYGVPVTQLATLRDQGVAP